MTGHAWVLLPSGRQLDLLAQHPCAWTDGDLAVRLSRTYRWCSDTRWAHPLSVAQHSLTVLHLRQAMAAQPLTPAEQLRELLHDAEEALVNHDVPTPLKPLLGDGYRAMTTGLRRAIDGRYDLPRWSRASHDAHKHADRLAAASEAHHVVGWPEAYVRARLGITLSPLADDPLPLQPALQPWEPWPASLAARLFQQRLEQLQRDTLGADDMMEVAVLLPGSMGLHGARSGEHPTFVLVDGGGATIDGRVVKGLRDEHGTWDFDSMFTVQTENGELIKVRGWNCVTEVV